MLHGLENKTKPVPGKERKIPGLGTCKERKTVIQGPPRVRKRQV